MTPGVGKSPIYSPNPTNTLVVLPNKDTLSKRLTDMGIDPLFCQWLSDNLEKRAQVKYTENCKFIKLSEFSIAMRDTLCRIILLQKKFNAQSPQDIDNTLTPQQIEKLEECLAESDVVLDLNVKLCATSIIGNHPEVNDVFYSLVANGINEVIESKKWPENLFE